MPWSAQIESFAAQDWHVLARHWHPVAYSHEVGERPFASRLPDQDLVAFRTEHGVTVARDICLHRGARLSRGTLQADEIICPYHGFRYNWKGACTLIPAQDPKVPISTRLNLKTYPQQTVLDEDQPMVEDQRPEELPLELAEEVHIQADRFSIAFRQALRELGLGRPFSS